MNGTKRPRVSKPDMQVSVREWVLLGAALLTITVMVIGPWIALGRYTAKYW